MIQFLTIALTAFAASFILLPFIIRFSKKKNLLVAPGKRRIHKMLLYTLIVLIPVFQLLLGGTMTVLLGGGRIMSHEFEGLIHNWI